LIQIGIDLGVREIAMLHETAAEIAHADPNSDRTHLAPARVREQLQRILKNPLFQTSKRYPSVLRYLVERALEESPEALKERTIGIEVLGREPDYDTNQDPTVRVVAGEIRKRLLSYYGEPGHASEIRIELPIGSYTPKFTVSEPSTVGGPTIVAKPATVVEPSISLHSKHRRNFWILGSSLLATVFVFLGGYSLLLPSSALDRFWAPVLRGSPPVLLCVGQQTAWGSQAKLNDPIAQPVDSPQEPMEKTGTDNTMHRFFSTQPVFNLMTMTSATNIASFLRPKSSKELIRAASATSLEDLRQGPAVLIGSYSNYWVMHVSEDLRFRFMRSNEEGVNWIEDRENSSKRDWAVKVNAPYTDVTQDYAIITRLRDRPTGQTLVSVGGVTAIGTLAASEFVVNSAGWEAVARQAPRDWEHKNVQIVLGVNVINGNAGTPSVLATYFW
jgi:hypothetical protein